MGSRFNCFWFLRSFAELKRNAFAGLKCFLLVSSFCFLPRTWAGNRALEFDGVDDRAVSALGAGLYNLNDFTIEAWTKLSPNVQGGGFSVLAGGNYFWGMGRFTLMGSNRAVFQCVEAKGKVCEVNVRTADNRGVWVFWALVRQGGNLRVYRNSVLAGEGSISASDTLRLSSQDGVGLEDTRRMLLMSLEEPLMRFVFLT